MIQFFKKSFEQWLEVKPKIHEKEYPSLRVKEGEVFWYHCGENIGTEICGKGEDFFRPGVIYKVLSFKSCIIIPLTTSLRFGSWYAEINSLKKKSFACLHQIQSIDKKRLDVRLGEISFEEMQQIQLQFKNLYVKKDPPDCSGGREDESS